LSARRRTPKGLTLIGDIVGFATWCFWRCPLPITDFLLEIYEGRRRFPINPILLREGVGRIVHRGDQLERYFAAVDSKLKANGSLVAAEFSALGRVLGGCPDAAKLLPKVAADRILQETIAELASQNSLPRKYAYKRRCKAALLMLAALLRHREVRPSFLDPEESIAVQELLAILAEAEGRSQQFREAAAARAVGMVRSSHRAAAKRFDNNSDILRKLIEFIRKAGSDPNIIRKIEELED
jgi:hypothetical protein